MKKFTAYWLDGTREVLEGKTAQEAFMLAGYSSGAIRALDFICNGEDYAYEWNNRKWVKVSSSVDDEEIMNPESDNGL